MLRLQPGQTVAWIFGSPENPAAARARATLPPKRLPGSSKIDPRGSKKAPRPAKITIFVRKFDFAKIIEKHKENQCFWLPQPAQNRHKMAPSPAKMAQDDPRSLQDGPKTSQDHPKTAPRSPQERAKSPRSPPREPKRLPRDPKRPLRSPKGLPRGPKSLPRRRKRPQEPPKRHLRSTKSTPKGFPDQAF